MFNLIYVYEQYISLEWFLFFFFENESSMVEGAYNADEIDGMRVERTVSDVSNDEKSRQH